ncbi:MAG: sulfur oxidation c-type cytochrome SoxX, partial [Hyphomicrobiaceae bacterium]|nr:sulfur oxidation c-type cytochrome SoxX [Hyphomicrobiaceae bacterium]
MKAKLFLAALAAASFGSSAIAADVAPKDVKFKDRAVPASLTGKPGDPRAGRKWFVGRRLGNCLACHANKEASDHQFHGDVGPALDGVGGRYTVAQLRGIVINS